MRHIGQTGFLLIFLAGYTTRTFTNIDRAAIEQLLLSGSVDKAVEKFYLPQTTTTPTRRSQTAGGWASLISTPSQPPLS